MRPPGSPEQLENRRRKAIQLLAQDITLAAVAKKVGSSVSSVFRWQQAFQQHGVKGLDSISASGCPPKLSKAQKEQLVKVLLKGPAVFGYPFNLWTTRRVAVVIYKMFGIQYHPNHI